MSKIVNLDNHRIQTGNLTGLKDGDGGGTSEGMSIVDAKIAAAEARTDAKFVEVLSELRAIKDTTKGTKTTVILAAIAAVGVAIGAMALGASQFGNGVMVTSAAVQDSAEAKRIALENAAEVRALRNDFGTLIHTLQEGRGQKTPAPSNPPNLQFMPAPSQQ